MLCYSLGPVDQNTVEKVVVEMSEEDKIRQERVSSRPGLAEILNLHDFEASHTHFSILFTQI